MLGDKYSLLIQEMQNVISALEAKIKDKNIEKKKLDEDYNKSEEQAETIEREIEENKKYLNFLKPFESKNLIITIIKEIAKGIAKAFKNSAFFEKIMFFMLLTAFIPLMYVSNTFPIMIIFFSSIYVFATLYSYYEIKKRRKVKSVEDCEKEIFALEKKLEEAKAKIAEISVRVNDINHEISKLDIKVAECMNNLEQVQKSRASIMEKLVSEIDLNMAFNLDITGEILKRTREIEKEGLE